jgi:hypothetical protein
VLENYHLAESFKLLKKPNCNIFEKLDQNDFKTLRKKVIESVLATDMAMHSKLIGTVTSKYLVRPKLDNLLNSDNNQSTEFSISNFIAENSGCNKQEIQQDLINFVLHAVDIGHAAKPFELELKWAELVTMEFHNQGDTEKKLGLQVSFLCDRTTSNLPASQVGFINGIVLPTFQVVVSLLPSMMIYCDLIEKSRNEWEKLKELKGS